MEGIGSSGPTVSAEGVSIPLDEVDPEAGVYWRCDDAVVEDVLRMRCSNVSK